MLVKFCLECEKSLKGRSDKKFCDDFCRNSYNNKLRSGVSNCVRNVNNALNKNRRILERLLKNGEDSVRASREQLLQQGFQFRYLTHLYTTRAGKTYSFCYDHGYLPLGNDWFLVVRTGERAKDDE